LASQRQPSQDHTTHSAKVGERAISAPTVDDVLRALVRLLARQAARDWLTVSSHPADQTPYEEAIRDPA